MHPVCSWRTSVESVHKHFTPLGWTPINTWVNCYFKHLRVHQLFFLWVTNNNEAATEPSGVIPSFWEACKCRVNYGCLWISCCHITLILFWPIVVLSAYCFIICHLTCCSANHNTFSHGNTMSAGLAKCIVLQYSIVLHPKMQRVLQPSSYFGSASILKWPQK